MEQRALYVIAGPNGIGKTTSTYDLVPGNVQVINSDEIAKQVKLAGIAPEVNTYEYSNREASRLIQQNIDENRTFGFETNLCDTDTWKFLIGIKSLGYRVELLFLSTDSLDTLNQRIAERTSRGEHYVSPEVVEERYVVGLKLLSHYFDVPDRLIILDNSTHPKIVLEKKGANIQTFVDPLPQWVDQYLGNNIRPNNQEKPPAAKDLSSVDDIRDLYRKTLKKQVVLYFCNCFVL